MRVISGSARGKKLLPPKGADIRPTGDKVKGAVFNIIQEHINGARALDLFSGTGQLGIEALSRGAASCVFVDSSPASLELTRKNIEAARLTERAEILRADALEYIKRAGRFDIVFLDPPYDGGLLDSALANIFEFDILAERGIIVCESGSGHLMPESEAPYKKLREYTYGSVKITIYIKETTV
ncbi:MAG: 16S rRNA (guanine(966)-N(2))-methyltransferase RsmD [Oscillospiraceae bacterium]|jgi:16S rRNA (guanine(966)-N(2))-methyltransferase RsmD|nr:16S rRNA (guanine(966)-N(2))-methyltransferase RsmD [Oscillospiraceae bacterium]